MLASMHPLLPLQYLNQSADEMYKNLKQIKLMQKITHLESILI
jgi:hypothetical protein